LPVTFIKKWPQLFRHSFVITRVPVVGVGVGVCLTVLLPSGQVLTVTVQAVLLILFVLDPVTLELEVLSAEFVFVFVLRSAKEFCIIGTIDVPTTSIDVIAATTTMIPLIVWFIFFSQ
jgi:hypothetical protein